MIVPYVARGDKTEHTMVDTERYAALGDEAHINLRTFRRNGEAVDTPVWFTVIKGRLYLRTVADSGKVKRLRARPQVQYAPCRWNGELLGEWRDGRARLLDDDEPVALQANKTMEEKYGSYRREMSELMAQLNKPLCYIEVSPE